MIVLMQALNTLNYVAFGGEFFSIIYILLEPLDSVTWTLTFNMADYFPKNIKEICIHFWNQFNSQRFKEQDFIEIPIAQWIM